MRAGHGGDSHRKSVSSFLNADSGSAPADGDQAHRAAVIRRSLSETMEHGPAPFSPRCPIQARLTAALVPGYSCSSRVAGR